MMLADVVGLLEGEERLEVLVEVPAFGERVEVPVEVPAFGEQVEVRVETYVYKQGEESSSNMLDISSPKNDCRSNGSIAGEGVVLAENGWTVGVVGIVRMTVDNVLSGGWMIGWTAGGVVTSLVPATLNTGTAARGRAVVTFGVGVVAFNIVSICCMSSDSIFT